MTNVGKYQMKKCMHAHLTKATKSHLGQWKMHAKEIIVMIQRLYGTIQGKATRFALSGRGVYVNQHAVLGLCLDKIEFPDAKG